MFKSAVKILRVMASLKISFAGILLLLAGVLLSYFDQQKSVIWIALPLIFLAVNLLAAIIFNPRIRQNNGLLMFHFCLLALVLFAALSQLTSMKARVEIVQGQVFDSEQVTVVRKGPLHDMKQLSKINFVQGPIDVAYSENLRRGETRSQLYLEEESVVVGDNTAFNHLGYRFYTTSNKGYAVILGWLDESGRYIQGAVHFPSFPLYDWKQKNQWKTPAGQLLKLKFTGSQQTQLDKNWSLDSRTVTGSLTIESAAKVKQALSVGQRVQLEGGQLELVAVRLWMGYSIFYNPWLAWFFAFSIVGVFGIAWHYYLKLGTQSKTNQCVNQSGRNGRGIAVS